jgi:carboxyl-terminal processing protease
MSHRNLLLLLGVLAVSYTCYVRAEQNPYARYVAAGFSIIDRWSLVNPPDEELFNAAMNGMVGVLNKKYEDEHSEFIDAERQDAYREDYEQEFGGVGLRMWILGEPPLPTVIGPPEPGSPAAAAGVLVGDRLAAIDGKSTAGLELDKVTELVRGPKDSTVKLTFQRAGDAQPRDVTVTRAVINVESVYGDTRGADGRWNFIVSETPRIAYVRIRKFGDKTAAELSSLLNTLNSGAKPLEGLILDVRDDPGGVLDAAIKICDLFLRAGQTIVTTRGRDQNTVLERAMATGSGNSTLPVAVLIDRNSASASEILAACLQDYDRAAIVGERSYGKGTVQRLVRVESGRSLLKITAATYWRPSGKNIHRMPHDGPDVEWGVTPDPELRVQLDDQEYDQWRRYRARRDLVGDDVDSELAVALDFDGNGDGKIPNDFQDRILERAIEHLKAAPAR